LAVLCSCFVARARTQSKYEAESRQRREEEARDKTEFMLGIEDERRKVDAEFANDVIRLEHMYRVMADTD
jgi:hypothetical protein